MIRNLRRSFKMKKCYVAVALFVCLCFCMNCSEALVFANQEIPILEGGTEAPAELNQYEADRPLTRASQGKSTPVPGGTLISNAWRSSAPQKSGNTLQWDYQVSAVYNGSYAVETIRTTWRGSASLRNSGAISLGLGDSCSASASSSWSSVKTVSKYWENNNGSKSASYRSNMIVTPSKDYRSNTISIINTAKVKLKKDARSYSISAGV